MVRRPEVSRKKNKKTKKKKTRKEKKEKQENRKHSRICFKVSIHYQTRSQDQAENHIRYEIWLVRSAEFRSNWSDHTTDSDSRSGPLSRKKSLKKCFPIPFASDVCLCGQQRFRRLKLAWARPIRWWERKGCWSPVRCQGWPLLGSHRIERKPGGIRTVPPLSTFVGWTWSGLHHARQSIPRSLWVQNGFYRQRNCSVFAR